MLSYRSVALPILALACTGLTAQETHWIANRTSGDVMEVALSGEVLTTVTLGNSLRSAHVAPDGKIWVVRFIQSNFDILAPDGTPISSPAFSLGSPGDIAFDANGHAWVSGGTGVEEFDANGNLVQTIGLQTTAPLGIAVDSQGNKWIAHRFGPPGAISRIDAVTGNVTVHPLPAGSNILPTRVYADARGMSGASHIWVIGDRGGELHEFDINGTYLNGYTLDSSGNFGSIVVDVDASLMARTVYIGDFRNGNLWAFDIASATSAPTSFAPDVIGLNIDGTGNLWLTSRGVTEVRRVDIATKTLEAVGSVGSGVQSALSTGWAWATTVAPTLDFDGDTVPNFLEVQIGSSPFEPCSTPIVALSTDGPSDIGSTTTLRVHQTSGALAIAFAFGTAAPITIPGIACQFDLDPVLTLPFSVTITGSVAVPLPIPNDPALVGQSFYFQGLHISGTTGRFTNLASWLFR